MAPAVPLLPLWQRAQLALERRDRTPGTLKTRPQPIPFLCSFFQLPAPPPGVTAEVLQRQALALQARLEVVPLRPEFLHSIRGGPRALFPTAPPPAPGETLASVGLGRRGTGAEHGAALGRTERRSPGCPPRTGPATSLRRRAPPCPPPFSAQRGSKLAVVLFELPVDGGALSLYLFQKGVLAQAQPRGRTRLPVGRRKLGEELPVPVQHLRQGLGFGLRVESLRRDSLGLPHGPVPPLPCPP